MSIDAKQFEDFKRILSGINIPNISATLGLDIVEVLKPQFEEKYNKWKFDSKLFKLAAEDKWMPPIMPVFDYATYVGRIILSPEYAHSWLLKNSKSLTNEEKPYLLARIYQHFTGHLREIDCVLKVFELYPDARVKKNYRSDLKEDTDFVFVRNDIKLKIAIRHEGATSSRYLEKKQNKGNDIIELRADLTPRDKLHLVSHEQLKNKISGAFDQAISKTKIEIQGRL